MFVDEIILASRDDESDYFNSAAHTLDMPLGHMPTRPFGVFPKLGIGRISLGKITLFCGGSNTPRDHLMEVIAAVLGADIRSSCDKKRLMDYASLCVVRFHSQKDTECVYIGKQEIYDEMREQLETKDFDKTKSMAQIYGERIFERAIYVIEMPESGMSVEETAEVASLVYDTATQTGAQFIISTSSPIFMGIKGAVIYDLDKRPWLPQTYHNSDARKRFSKIYDKICAEHKRKDQ